MPPEMPQSYQQMLDEQVGLGRFLVCTDAGVARCLVCPLSSQRTIDLSNSAWLYHAKEHDQKHREAMRGMTPLTAYYVAPCSIPLNAAPRPVLPRPDHSTICHGFWLPTVYYTIDGAPTAFYAPALMHDLNPGGSWYQVPRYKATVEFMPMPGRPFPLPLDSNVTWTTHGLVATGRLLGFATPTDLFVRPDSASTTLLDEAGLLLDAITAHVDVSTVTLVVYNIQGTYKHNDCCTFCVDTYTGEPHQNLMCPNCRSIKDEDDFRMRILRGLSYEGPVPRTRIDRYRFLGDLVDRTRSLTVQNHTYGLERLNLQRALGRSHARELTLQERLENNMVTGDLRGLADDLRFCQVMPPPSPPLHSSLPLLITPSACRSLRPALPPAPPGTCAHAHTHTRPSIQPPPPLLGRRRMADSRGGRWRSTSSRTSCTTSACTTKRLGSTQRACDGTNRRSAFVLH